ncbi:hypothetical protein ACIQPT_13520 [Streptomyces sp. NPDC091289]|uniref:hypothetical protein n=1 Tax=Streptomyces sp. NPDC091289 TaxID=3365989 RepID=UPI0038197412
MNEAIKKLAGFAALVCVVTAAWGLISGKGISEYWLPGVLLVGVRALVVLIPVAIHRKK